MNAVTRDIMIKAVGIFVSKSLVMSLSHYVERWH